MEELVEVVVVRGHITEEVGPAVVGPVALKPRERSLLLLIMAAAAAADVLSDTQSANAPESEANLLVVATTACNNTPLRIIIKYYKYFSAAS